MKFRFMTEQGGNARLIQCKGCALMLSYMSIKSLR